jgi:hypothetical protein
MRKLALTAYLVPATLAPFCSQLNAQSSCGSDFIFQNHVSCTVPADQIVYAEDRTQACGPESFNSCSHQGQLVLDSTFFGHFNEKNPNGDGGNCRVQAWDPPTRRNILYRIIRVDRSDLVSRTGDSIAYKYSYYDLGRSPVGLITWSGLSGFRSGFPSVDIDSDLVSFDITSARRTGQYGLNGSNWWYMDCDFHAVFSISLNEPSPVCGVAAYNLCRDPSHGMDGAILKKYCPVNTQQIVLFDTDTSNAIGDVKLLAVGEKTCAIASQMPEKSPADVAKKIAALQNNLAILKSGSLDPGILPKDGGKVVSVPAASKPLPQLQVLLEMARLYMGSGRKWDSDQAVSDIKALVWTNGLESMIDLLIQKHRPESLKTLAAVLPDQITDLSHKLRGQYLTMNGDKYALLFPQGVLLTDDEVNVAVTQVEFMSDAEGVYRMAESAVISGLKKVRALQNTALDLMDLKVLYFQQSIDYKLVAKRIEEIYGPSDEPIEPALEQYKDNLDDLRSAISQIIRLRVSGLKDQADKLKGDLWRIIDVIPKSSKDPRVPLLAGYRALDELRADDLRRSIETATEQVRKASSTREFENSVQLLVKSAKDNLQVIDSLQRILSKTTGQQTIVGAIAEATKDNDASDQMADRIATIVDSISPGAGLGFALRGRLVKLIQTTYDQFSAALRQIPEVTN